MPRSSPHLSTGEPRDNSLCIVWVADVTRYDDSLHWELIHLALDLAQEILPLDAETPEQYLACLNDRMLAEDRVAREKRIQRALQFGHSSYSNNFRVLDCLGIIHAMRDEVRIQSLRENHWRCYGSCYDLSKKHALDPVSDYALTHMNGMVWYADVREIPEKGFRWHFHFPMFDAAQRFLGVHGETANELMERLQSGIEPHTLVEMDARSHEALQDNTHGYTQEFAYSHPERGQVWLREDVHLESLSADEWRMIGMVMDVSEVHTARAEYQSLFERVPVGLYRMTPDGQIAMANPAYHKLFGGTSFPTLARNGDDHSWNEFVVQRSEGEVVVLREHAQAIRNQEGSVMYYEGTLEDITEQRAMEARIVHQAMHDALTGLPNRTFFMDSLQAAIHAKRPCAVLFLDLDRFKNINDTLGHGVGDKLLRSVARRLQRFEGPECVVARMGGDEFTLLYFTDSPQASMALARKVLQALRARVRLRSYEFHISASIGICDYPEHGCDVETLLRRADIAMYRAKSHGGSQRCERYTDVINERTAERLRIESDLRRALSRNELVLLYQPQVDGNSGSLIGVEALVRWCHPERGLVPPMEFIPIAEETGLIYALGEKVLAEACRQGKRWLDAGTPVKVAVNLSARQLTQPDLVSVVKRWLKRSGLPAYLLELELTETALLQPGVDVENTLRSLKALGVHLSVDDFGTGYSSLVSLRRYAFDALKIDRSFVYGMTNRTEDQAIVEAVVGLAQALQIGVIAEGVETTAHRSALIEIGCPRMQGYYFAKPLPAIDVATWLAATAQLATRHAA